MDNEEARPKTLSELVCEETAETTLVACRVLREMLLKDSLSPLEERKMTVAASYCNWATGGPARQGATFPVAGLDHGAMADLIESQN